MLDRKFDAAFDLCMKLEGGGKYHEVKNDKGGATKYGVSLRFLKDVGIDINDDGVVDKMDIRELTEEEAKKISYKYFYNKMYSELSQPIAVALFCTGYNMGTNTGVKLLQRACNSLGGNLVTDGVIGVNTILETKKHKENSLLVAYVSEMMDKYIDICLVNSSQMKFLKGWKNRSLKFLI